jgi:hypothetical protein
MTQLIANKEIFTEKQLDGFYGLTAAVLRKYRTGRPNKGQVPKSFKIGGRVYYSKDALVDWLKQQK